MSNIHPIQVFFGDTDGAGIAYYPNFYRWMDQATHELFKAKGIALPKLKEKKKVIVPLVEAKCNFKQPLFHDDEVDVLSEVKDIKNKTLKIKHSFIRNEVEIASGYEIRVWTSIGPEGLKGIHVPEDMRNLLKKV